MKNFWENTTDVIGKYNQILNKIYTSKYETDEKEDEFHQNFCMYLAHALIKDVGYDGHFREELCKVADIINDVLR